MQKIIREITSNYFQVSSFATRLITSLERKLNRILVLNNILSFSPTMRRRRLAVSESESLAVHCIRTHISSMEAAA